MAFIELLVVIVAVLVVFWVFLKILKSILKAVGAVILAIFILAVIFGGFFYMDYKNFMEEFPEGESLLVLLDVEDEIMMGMSIIPGELDAIDETAGEFMDNGDILNKIENYSEDTGYYRILVINEELLREGLGETVDLNEINVTKEDYFEALHAENDDEAFILLAGAFEQEQDFDMTIENINDVPEDILEEMIGDVDIEEMNVRGMLFAAGVMNVADEKGYRWFIQQYKEGKIEIVPETFIFRMIKILPV